jgi:hypothetical protein
VLLLLVVFLFFLGWANLLRFFYSMLAVMTMNVGYFLSVLGGTFLGSLLVGRFAVATEH